MSEYIKGRRTAGHRGNTAPNKFSVNFKHCEMFTSAPRHELLKVSDMIRKRNRTIKAIREYELENMRPDC